MECITEKNNLDKRIFKTLQIVEERDYNLTINQLAEKLIGGSISIRELKKYIENNANIDCNGILVATKGNLRTDKCFKRIKSNQELQTFYQTIVQEYVSDFHRICPWLRCIMIGGSMASDGIGEGDDIDLNFIVQDGFKFTSYLLALLLSLKYSLKYGKDFWWHYVICINVVWEEHQVLPFERQNGQIAYELFNARPIFNKRYFNQMISHNKWLKEWFPQRFHSENEDFIVNNKEKKGYFALFFEFLSRKLLISLTKLAIAIRSNDKDFYKKFSMKQPYSVLDIPKMN
jgi:hypothetical protein